VLFYVISFVFLLLFICYGYVSFLAPESLTWLNQQLENPRRSLLARTIFIIVFAFSWPFLWTGFLKSLIQETSTVSYSYQNFYFVLVVIWVSIVILFLILDFIFQDWRHRLGSFIFPRITTVKMRYCIQAIRFDISTLRVKWRTLTSDISTKNGSYFVTYFTIFLDILKFFSFIEWIAYCYKLLRKQTIPFRHIETCVVASLLIEVGVWLFLLHSPKVGSVTSLVIFFTIIFSLRLIDIFRIWLDIFTVSSGRLFSVTRSLISVVINYIETTFIFSILTFLWQANNFYQNSSSLQAFDTVKDSLLYSLQTILPNNLNINFEAFLWV
jgi:hypothetical protein